MTKASTPKPGLKVRRPQPLPQIPVVISPGSPYPDETAADYNYRLVQSNQRIRQGS